MNLTTQRGFEFGIDIQDINVPEYLRRRVPFDVDYLDNAWGGMGMTPSMVTLFTGMSGAGKTTMLLNGCNGLVRGGAEVLFNTCEENLYQVRLHAERLGLHESFRLGELSNMPQLLRSCEDLRAKSPDKNFVLVVDSLQTMNDGKWGVDTNSKTPLRVLEMITNWCKDTKANAIVIGQVGKNGKFLGSNKLRHMVDAQIELSIDFRRNPETNPTYGLRKLETTKNRFGGGATTTWLRAVKGGFLVEQVDGQEINEESDTPDIPELDV